MARDTEAGKYANLLSNHVIDGKPLGCITCSSRTHTQFFEKEFVINKSEGQQMILFSQEILNFLLTSGGSCP